MKIAFIVVYLVVAIAMIAFIMLQRGSGAAAGSGFGSGASGTVFGARGSANFLSKATKWLAVVFFAMSMGMAVYEARVGIKRDAAAELGVMGELPTPAAPTAGSEVPAAGGEVPSASETPAAPAASTSSDTPAVPAGETPAASTNVEAPAAETSETAPAETSNEGAKPQ